MSVEQRLRDLVAALTEALEAAKAQGAQAFQSGEFEAAELAANRGKAIAGILEGAQRLRDDWKALDQPGGHDGQPEFSAEVSASASEEDLIYPILYVLEEMGSKAYAAKVLDRVEALLEEKLTTQEYTDLCEAWGGPLRGLQAKLETILLQRGLIHGNSPHGVWHITPQGRIALLDQQS